MAGVVLRGLLLYAALAIVGLVGVSAISASGATYTTSSSSAVTASADGRSAWLHVYSEGTDPQGQTGYARRRGLNGIPGPVAATGLNDALRVDLGDFPDKNASFSLVRVFSVRTPDAFPDAAVGQLTLTVSVLPDPETGENLLRSPTLTAFGQANGGARTVTLGPGAKYQVNLIVRMRKTLALGQTYLPRIRLSMTVDGLAGYYTYEFPVQVRDAGGS